MILPILVALLLSSGCNNDIFVDDIDMPLSDDITLDGDGGEATLGFDPSGLQSIYVESNYYYMGTATYYDRNGKEVDAGCPARDIGSLTYTNIGISFEAQVGDGQLMLHSIENALLDPKEIYLTFDYGHFAVTVTVTVLPGQPLEVTEMWLYKGKDDVTQNAHVSRLITHYNNSGPSEISAEVLPYSGQEAVAVFTPDDVLYNGFAVAAQLPLCEGDDWTLDGIRHEIVFGEQLHYQTVDADTSVSLTIPPYSNIDVISEVKYSSVKVRYGATFTAPVTGREFLSIGECCVIQPVNYEILINEVH